MSPHPLLLCLLLASCEQDDPEPRSPSGRWQGTCEGELNLEIELELDEEGLGAILVAGDLERDEQVEALWSEDGWFRLVLENQLLYEYDDTFHGGTASVHSQLELDGDWDENGIRGSCWDKRTNSIAEDDSTWGDEGVLSLQRAP
jgi:hypothetical protein